MTFDTSPLNLPSDPVDGFLAWLRDAEAAKAPEPTAMSLATSSADGKPNVRIVLFKGFASRGSRRAFQFFTNYESTKSKELAANPRAALAFYWAQLSRQIRVEGRVEKLSPQESDVYFQSRPRGSRIGAWASPQSQKINSRAELIEHVRAIEERFKDSHVPCPPDWGGWCVIPDRIEFWQAGDSRLHDRFAFTWMSGHWQVDRLAP